MLEFISLLQAIPVSLYIMARSAITFLLLIFTAVVIYITTDNVECFVLIWYNKGFFLVLIIALQTAKEILEGKDIDIDL